MGNIAAENCSLVDGKSFSSTSTVFLKRDESIERFVAVADFQLCFPAIASSEQRCKYKHLFDVEYPHYMAAYDFLIQSARDIERCAARLDCLRRESPAAAECEALEREVTYFQPFSNMSITPNPFHNRFGKS